MPPYLYVVTSGGDDGLTIVDVAGTPPAFVGHLGAGVLFRQGGQLAVFGDYCYIPSQQDDGVAIIDVSIPANPTYVGGIFGIGAPNYLEQPTACDIRPAPSGLFLHVVSFVDSALTIFNVDDPLNPTLAGVIRGGGAPPGGNYLANPRTIAVDDNFRAYVLTATDNRLVIFDVSNPTAPSYLGSTIFGATNGRKVIVRGIYAYVAAYGFPGTLTILDISDPTAPVRTGVLSHATMDELWSIELEGNYIYAASQGAAGYLAIFDVSDPTGNPVFVSQLIDARFQSPRGVVYPRGRTGRIWILGSNVAADSVAEIDVANPAAPAYVNWLQGSGAPNYITTPQFIAESKRLVPVVQTNPATEVT